MLLEGRSCGASGMETTLPSVGATDAQAQFLAEASGRGFLGTGSRWNWSTWGGSDAALATSSEPQRKNNPTNPSMAGPKRPLVEKGNGRAERGGLPPRAETGSTHVLAMRTRAFIERKPLHG